jgi:hypothetical protein
VTSGGFSSKRLTRVRDVLSRHLDAGYVPGAVARTSLPGPDSPAVIMRLAAAGL